KTGGQVPLSRRLDVDESIRGCAIGLRLESDGEPAVGVVPRIASRGDRVGENEEDASIAAPGPELFEKQPILVVEYCLEVLPDHVAIGRPVQQVAHRGVVCRYGRSHRSRDTADLKNYRATSWPAPISSTVPYLVASTLI